MNFHITRTQIEMQPCLWWKHKVKTWTHHQYIVLSVQLLNHQVTPEVTGHLHHVRYQSCTPGTIPAYLKSLRQRKCRKGAWINQCAGIWYTRRNRMPSCWLFSSSYLCFLSFKREIIQKVQLSTQNLHSLVFTKSFNFDSYETEWNEVNWNHPSL